MATPGSSLRADAALLGLTVLWGITFVAVKDSLAFTSPFAWLTARFLLGAAVATPFAARHGLRLADLRSGAVLGLFLFVGFVLQTTGLALTTPSRSAFITGLYIAIVPFLSFALLRRPPKASSLVGIGVALVGLYLLTGGGGGPSGRLVGDLLTLGCAVAFAFHIVWTERYAPTAPPTVLAAVQLWVVAGLSALALPFESVRLQWSGSLVASLVFCGVFVSAFATSVQTWAQARTSSVRAALLFAMEPVFAAACSVALGRERLEAPELWGGGLIVSGVLLGELGGALVERRRRSAPPAPTSGL